MNLKNIKHNHAEAFCHMQYFGQSTNGSQIILSIWNSRDGVTPFIMFSKEFGIELKHVNWQRDRYDPHYKPKKGDLIWRNYTEQEAKDSAQRQIDRWIAEKARLEALTDEEYKVKNLSFSRSAMIKQLIGMIEDPARFIEENAKQTLLEGQPFFELVKEDWL